MSSYPIPDNLEREISEALTNLYSPKKLSESHLLSLSIVAKYQEKNPSALPYQTLKAVLTDILDLLEEENADYAEILRGRFWEGFSPANMIANARPKQWSEKTFYNYQKKARQEFRALLWQKEQECLQEDREKSSELNILPSPGILDEEPLPASKTTVEPLSPVKPPTATAKFLLPVGLLLLIAILVFVTQFSGRPNFLQQPPGTSVTPTPATTALVAPEANTPTAETNIVAAAPTSESNLACGAGTVDPILVDGGVPRFLRNQGVSSFTVENTPGVLNNKVRSLFIDHSGLWIGYFATETNAYNGLGHYNRTNKTLVNCDHVSFLKGQNINAIAADQQGNLWVGTEKNGLAAFDGKDWQHYSTVNGLPSNEIYGITIDQQNNVWAGTWEGVAKFDGSSWTVPYTVHNDTLFNDHVHSILFDSQGNIWVGHIEKGMSMYSQADGSWVHLTAAPGGLGGNKIRSMALRKETDSNPESVWVATQDGGVSKFENGVWTNYRVEDGLPSNNIRSVTIDKYNRVWAATAQGVVYWDNQKWITYNTLNTISVAFGVHCPDKTCPIDDDHVWTGTATAGLTQSRLPLLESETPFDVVSVCFESKERGNICPPVVQDPHSGDLLITFPETIESGEQFLVSVTLTPRADYALSEERGDMLANTDADDANLFGLWTHFKVEGTVEQGEPFTFVDHDNLLQAPQLPGDVQEKTFTSTWRVWRHNRFVGPFFHLIFSVKKP